MRKKNRLVYGIGVNDFDGEVRTNGKTIKSYKCWSGILERCYSEKTRKKILRIKGVQFLKNGCILAISKIGMMKTLDTTYTNKELKLR